MISLCFKLFRLEIPYIVWLEYLNFYNKIPGFFQNMLSVIIQLYQNIESFLWLFMFFFAHILELVLFFLSKVRLNNHPYDFSAVLILLFLVWILWFFWFKKKL